MLDTYCSSLHSPAAQGNIRIGHGDSAFPILQGKTKNDYSTAFYLYAKAKLRAKPLLPRDFRKVLDRKSYFDLLENALNRQPRFQMDLDHRSLSIQRDLDLDAIWNAALSETVLRRMNQKYKGFHRLSDDVIPLEQSIESKRIRRELISSVSKAIWENDKNWSKVQSGFEKLRASFLAVIDSLDIPPEVRNNWFSRIKSVKLVIPGAIPAIADAECSTTQVNAFYYSHLNLITVCAGDFNSEDILQTVAHELAHSIDVGRSMYEFQKSSEIGQSTGLLRHEVCSTQTFSCDNWQSFKNNFEERLHGLQGFSPELPEFQRCLKRRATSKKLSTEDIDRFAESEVSEQVSDLARSGVFLRLTKKDIPLTNGQTTPNPNYLNPCNYRMWSQGEEPVDDELTQLLFFTAEYRCRPELKPADRLHEAILQSKEMATKIAAAVIQMEGEFSSREELEQEGYSSTPVERFADVLGNYAFAYQLSSLKDRAARRHRFLASSSWQCERPSLASLYPSEDSVQQAFALDSHAESDTRKTESFSKPIREVLGCEKDFQFNSCELKFKQ